MRHEDGENDLLVFLEQDVCPTMLTLGMRYSYFWDRFVNYKELKTVGGFTVDTQS